MNSEAVKGIPYGVADYGRIAERNYYYVDKTGFLETIEKAGDYLFFIRPRRFGKSLFLSMMEGYYDVLYKERFEELFKGTTIYDTPTKERGTYLVLGFNFSVVEPTADKVEASFLNHVKGTARLFLERYADYLSPGRQKIRQDIEAMNSGADILTNLIDLCKASNRQLYILIDEYDNFANTILSTSGRREYEQLTHGNSFFRTFFNVLKSGTSKMGAPISRLFLTGVSPVTMDDVTSGFNIGKNVTTDDRFNEMLGFTREEVTGIIDYYRNNGLIAHPTSRLLEIMDRWYNRYAFSKKSRVTLFNSDMVLYFLDEYLKDGEIPEELVDENVRIDYGKLRQLIIIDRGEGEERRKTTNGNFGKLKEIVEKGGTTAKLVRSFPAEKIVQPENFTSLLFYFGLLTRVGTEKGKVKFEIPNETVKRLYFEYIKEAYEETGIFSLDFSRYSELMTDMAYDGKWRELFAFLTAEMKERMVLRDLITGEKSIQAFLSVYLGLGDLFIIHTEKELSGGFADIVLEPFFIRYPGIRFSYILELKYIKTKEFTAGRLEKIRSEAADQLRNYSLDKKFRKGMEKTAVIKLLLIFSGTTLKHIEAINDQ